MTPGRYVGYAEKTDDGEPFDKKMKRLTTELAILFDESNKLQEDIKDKLSAIGYPLPM